MVADLHKINKNILVLFQYNKNHCLLRTKINFVGCVSNVIEKVLMLVQPISGVKHTARRVWEHPSSDKFEIFNTQKCNLRLYMVNFNDYVNNCSKGEKIHEDLAVDVS